MGDAEDMEGISFKKDEKPYIIFPCKKCGHYTYARLTQKGKKCFRCGRNHQIKKLKNRGEIVNGMTSAVERVKQRQNELAREELGKDPDFGSTLSFKKSFTPLSASGDLGNKSDSKDLDDYERLIIELKKKTKHYSEFPGYVIEIIAEEIGLFGRNLKHFINRLVKEGFLKRVERDIFRLYDE